MPAGIILFFLPQYWKLLRRNKAAAVTAVALLLTGIIFLIDANKAGDDVRYTADFAWLLLISVALVIFSADNAENMRSFVSRLTDADEVAIADRTIITDGTVERAEAHGELPTSTALIRNIGMWGVIISIIACTLILIYSYMSKTAAWWGIESWFIML